MLYHPPVLVKKINPTAKQAFALLFRHRKQAQAAAHITQYQYEVVMDYRPENTDMSGDTGRPPRLLSEVHRVLRMRHCDVRTEQVNGLGPLLHPSLRHAPSA